MKIELTKEQANQLIYLMDLATKAGGLEAAKISVPLTELIVKAVQDDND